MKDFKFKKSQYCKLFRFNIQGLRGRKTSRFRISHAVLSPLSETLHSMEIYTAKRTGLGTTDSAMRAILGILDAADGNPVLHDFDHAFRHQEGQSFVE